jgi:hypothetical protein
MKGWLQTLGLTALLAGQALANDVELVTIPSGKLYSIGISQLLTCPDQKSDDAHRQRCSGMYSRKAWGGSVDPFILVKFTKSDTAESDPLASLVIFEWNDENLIGRYRSDDAEVRYPIHQNNRRI